MKKQLKIAVLCAVLLSSFWIAGCQEEPVIGEENYSASIVLMSYEDVGDGFTGVVYREVNRFNALLVRSEVPVLAVFYSDMATVNSMVIPMLEQMAVDYRDRLQIVWVDFDRETDLAASFYVEAVPQFTVVVDAETKRSIVGFGEETSVMLEALVQDYID